MSSETRIIEHFNRMILNNKDSATLNKFVRTQIFNYPNLSLETFKFFLDNFPEIEMKFIYRSCAQLCDIDKLIYLFNNYQVDINDFFVMDQAIFKNKKNIIELLVQYGFNIESFKNDIFMATIQRQNEEILKYFLDIGLVPNEDSFHFCIGKPKSTQILIDYGIDPLKIAQACWKYMATDYHFLFEHLLLLQKSGVNLNTSISDFEKNNN